MNASELYRAGKLQEAIAAASAEVKASPSDAGKRNFLCELLCFAGDFERADKQLDALSQLRTDLAVTVALLRQLLRAAVWRRQFFEEGRVPEVVQSPSSTLARHLEASICLREQKAQAAMELLNQSQRERPAVSGICDGRAFGEIRDLDDLMAPVLEVLTCNGKYYWIEFHQIAAIEFDAVSRPLDLLWRPAKIQVREGPEGEVYLPVLYHGSEKAADDSIRLARSTSWSEDPNAPVRGLGQRMLLVEEDARPFLEIEQFTTATDQPK